MIGWVAGDANEASTKCLTAALLLIATASATSAQTYWSYGAYGPRARAIMEPPTTGVPNMAAAVATSTYARQAPSRYHWHY
jgi:hypothetical protein